MEVPAVFEPWCERNAARFLSRMSFSELRRAVSALSVIYVQDRGRMLQGAALDSNGKRAAFATFYAPLHFLTVWNVLQALELGKVGTRAVLDAGCGTGVAGAAWAIARGPHCRVRGTDLHPWAVEEARRTYRELGLRGTAARRDALDVDVSDPRSGVVAAYLVNEIPSARRDEALERLLGVCRKGGTVLVVEPVARKARRWWDGWAREFVDRGGRNDSWTFTPELPDIVRRLDRATGLDHSVLKARSLLLRGESRPRKTTSRR